MNENSIARYKVKYQLLFILCITATNMPYYREAYTFSECDEAW